MSVSGGGAEFFISKGRGKKMYHKNEPHRPQQQEVHLTVFNSRCAVSNTIDRATEIRGNSCLRVLGAGSPTSRCR